LNLVINSSRIEKTLYNDHIQTNLSEKLKAATTIILDPTTEQITTPTTVPSTEARTAPTTEPTAEPTADPSTEPTNGYSPMSVPPVFHSNYDNQPLVVIVRSSTKPTHAPFTTEPRTAPTSEPTAEPTADPSTEPTNGYSPMSVPPVFHTNHDNQPLLVFVRAKPTHVLSTTSILDPTTEPVAVPTADQTSHRPVMFRPTIAPSTTNSLVPNVISIDTV